MIKLRTIIEKSILKYLNYVFMIYFFMTLLFSRSFVGIYIRSIRIGEIFIAISFLLFLYFLIPNSKTLSIKKTNYNFRNVGIIIAITFVYFVYLSETSFFSPYTFKTSTYIWSIGMFYFGLNMKKINLDLKQLFILEIAFLLIFYVAIYEFPDSIIELFLRYSDKYEPHKGSDIGIFFILINTLIIKFDKYKRFSLYLFLLNCALFLPLTLYKSRGAFLGLLIFVFYELFKFNKSNKLLRLHNLPLVLVFISIATYSTIVSQTKDFPEEISPEVIASSYLSLGEYRLQHYQDDYPILYFENNRLYSGDGNLNWRLSMWQDQIDFMRSENILIHGSGYKDTLYVFTYDNTGYGNNRAGLDGSNENVHNFFIHVLSRGGLVHLFLILYFFYKIIRVYRINALNNNVIFYLLPILFIAFFDSSMENAHFPLIFYYFLGNIYFKKKATIA